MTGEKFRRAHSLTIRVSDTVNAIAQIVFNHIIGVGLSAVLRFVGFSIPILNGIVRDLTGKPFPTCIIAGS